MTESLARFPAHLRRALGALLVAIALCCTAGEALGHEFDKASLTLTEVSAGRFRVGWHASSAALEDDLAAPAAFPRHCRLDGAFLDCGARGLTGTIEFRWLEGTRTRVIVDITWKDGGHLLRVATADSRVLNVYGIPASAGVRSLEPILADYTRLGVEHILTGVDHLFFVIALTLLVSSVRSLIGAITAFTLAHSVTLFATVLGFAALPSPPVEASIALSIVFVCAECLRSEDSLARRVPAVVAFAFGLLHGFGFASALLDVGLPERHVPAALLSFNVGVELGQLAAIAIAGGVRLLAARLRVPEPWWRGGTVYVMGTAAAFWFVERLGAVFGKN
jgi:hydrogenase/urease accessory protein HupE